MQKLENKFNDILNDSLVYWEEVNFDQHNKECAEEAEKLAIAFANYCNSSGDCTELFDEFIEEYYGR